VGTWKQWTIEPQGVLAHLDSVWEGYSQNLIDERKRVWHKPVEKFKWSWVVKDRMFGDLALTGYIKPLCLGITVEAEH
jgi:hypothetical protein